MLLHIGHLHALHALTTSKHHRVTLEPGAGVPSASERADLVYNNWLIDIPMLMDVAVLYGRDNATLAKQLISQVALKALLASMRSRQYSFAALMNDIYSPAGISITATLCC